MKNMKKGIITAGMLAVIACAIMLCCRVTGRKNMPETDNASPAESEQRVKKVAASGRALVAYFSVPETDGVDASSGASRLVVDGKVMGNTAYVASVISEAAGADLFEIKTVRTYPASHKALIDAAKVEADNDARPELATHIADLTDYDVVFVGFPNWWYDMPMPLYSFFDEYDFGGKTVLPFCTHGGSRFSGAVKTIRGLEKEAVVLDGYSVSRDDVADSKDDILKWLESIGMKR